MYKKRVCLSCGKLFNSEGPENRRCLECKEYVLKKDRSKYTMLDLLCDAKKELMKRREIRKSI